MPSLRLLAILSASALVADPSIAGETPPPTPVSFAKHTLFAEFHCEGSAIGDIDKDGVADAVAGPWWFAWNGKGFDRKAEIYKPSPFDPKGYSNNFITFAADVTGDGLVDVMANAWPGKDVTCYVNPGAAGGKWEARICHPVVDNESPQFADITGDGRPELVFHTGGVLGYAEVGTKFPWTFTGVSEKGKWHKYTHGLGIGDVDGDGKADLLMAEGWWKQTPGQTPWPKQEAKFGGGGAQMHVYDVDGDGDNDVVTSLAAHGFGLAWFEQTKGADGKVAFTQRLIMGKSEGENPYGVKFSQLHAVELADIDGDGLKDIVTGKRYWAHGPKGDAEPDAPAVLYWFRLERGAAGVRFIPYKIDDDSGVGTNFAVGDVTGDKLPDVVVGNKKGGFVFTQSRAGAAK